METYWIVISLEHSCICFMTEHLDDALRIIKGGNGLSLLHIMADGWRKAWDEGERFLNSCK